MPQKYLHIDVSLTAHLCSLVFSATFHGHFEFPKLRLLKSISIFAPITLLILLFINHITPITRNLIALVYILFLIFLENFTRILYTFRALGYFPFRGAFFKRTVLTKYKYTIRMTAKTVDFIK